MREKRTGWEKKNMEGEKGESKEERKVGGPVAGGSFSANAKQD